MYKKLLTATAVSIALSGCLSDDDRGGSSGNSPSTVAISGESDFGSVLTAMVSDNNGLESATIMYSWVATDAEGIETVLDSTESTYTVTVAEAESNITVAASFIDDDGYSELARSLAVEIGLAPVNAEGMVSISGTPTAGSTLTADVTDTNGSDNATFTYAWTGNAAVKDQATYIVDATDEANNVSVVVTYVDDEGFDESITDTIAIPVAGAPIAGIVALSAGPYEVGDVITAEVTDPNVAGTITYAWTADGSALAETTNTYTTLAADAGKLIAVTASYTDGLGTVEAPTDDADSVVVNTVVADAAELTTALAAATAGDVIGLTAGTYSNQALTFDSVSLVGVAPASASASGVQASASTTIFSGDVCIQASGSDVEISNITFDGIDLGAGCVGDDASIIATASNFVFTNNTFTGDAEGADGDGDDTYHWVFLKGDNGLVERNTFSGKDVVAEGAVVKVSSATEGNTIQYNLFKDNLNASDDSSTYLVNLGSTTGTDAASDASMVFQYNRIHNASNGRRLIRVQTSGAIIKGNTIVDALGGISIEDGAFNTVTENIMIRTNDGGNGTSDIATGVILQWFGHTITNNYIAGMHAAGKDDGGIVFSVNELSQGTGGVPNSGNAQIIADGAADYSLTVTGNTVLNSSQPIVFATEIGSKVPVGDCDEMVQGTHDLYDWAINKFDMTFDANLIMNGLNANADKEGLYLDNVANTSDHVIEYDCDTLDRTNSAFTNSSGFSDSYASGDAYLDGPVKDFWQGIRGADGNGAFDSDSAVDQAGLGENTKDPAEYVTLENGLVEGTGDEADRGVDADLLYFIEDADVGVGSTWVRDQ